MEKEYKKNKEEFKVSLRKMINKFVEKNKIVSTGDRVEATQLHEGKYEITQVEFCMTSVGSLSPYLPILFYHGKPINKKGKVMENRKPVSLLSFKTESGFVYEVEHICYYMDSALDMRR